uniref:NADH dehydrogenase subunit 6 n=1 Tax=Thelepus plagiostoma TaxID=1084972 RepID=A0A8B6QMF3_9ANNE|nr:NADH dehydrogenase subunit 6 [Thelepus plagiostoma]QTJ29896.1 NADH dehydrogenase subunit 6 [Thelepus plagiostoma]
MLAMSMSLIFTAPILTTPLLLGLWVLLYSLAISTMTTMYTSSWFGLILFIIYIGGMLVMFAYFAALLPNQMYTHPLLLPFLLFSFFMLMMYIMNFKLSYLMPQFLFSNPMKMNTFLYSPEQTPILIFLVILLLLALILVVKMTKHTSMPLRPYH